MVSRGFRTFGAAAVAAVIALTLAGCGDAPKSSGSTEKGSLPDSIPLAKKIDPNGQFTFGLTSMAGSWDPIQSGIAYELETLKPVYDRLLEQTPDGTVGPMLATEFTPAQDGTSLTLKLRQGLKFSDGAAFNADAVKFNLDRTRGAGSKLKNDLYMITSVDVVDEYTVKINVSGWLASLPTVLSDRPGLMVSPAAATAGTLAAQPAGIGPYVLESFAPGDRAVFKRSANYWDKDAQNVETFTMRLIPDGQTRLNALLSGEIDGAQVSPSDIKTAQKSKINVVAAPSSWFLYLSVNTNVEPFDDVEARKALNMAFDREAIADGLYDGFCTPQIMPFVKGSAAYSDKLGDGLDKFPYDPKAAKKIFDKLGVSGKSFELAALNITIYTQFAEILQQQLEAVGIKVDVTTQPATEVLQKFSIDKTAAMMSPTHAGTSDPAAILQRMVAPSAVFNPGALPNAEIMKYASEAGATLDAAKSKEAYANLADEWVKNPPNIVPICNQVTTAGFTPEVSGVTQSTMGPTDLRHVAITK